MKKLSLIFTLLLFTFPLFAKDPEGKTVCLNMIVKDEKDVIERCLASVKPIIDTWVIVDTGSTDGTQQIIKEYLKDIPGELYESPWKNFGHNRNEALQLAKFKADYVLIIDADDTLNYSENFKLPSLTHDAYNFAIHDAGSQYFRPHLINNHIEWKWVGVLHEYLSSTESKSYTIMDHLSYIRNYDGARTKDPEKYLKDSKVLEEALKNEPDNLRYHFYLAESYKNAGLTEKAIEQYKKRATLGGWQEEAFWSLLQAAILQETLKKPSEIVVDAYNKAFQYRPTRAEPLFYLSRYYRGQNQFYAACMFAKQGLSIPKPNDYLFLESWIYDYGFDFELSISSYWVGDYECAMNSSKKLIANPNLPGYYKDCVINNLKWINAKLDN